MVLNTGVSPLVRPVATQHRHNQVGRQDQCPVPGQQQAAGSTRHGSGHGTGRSAAKSWLPRSGLCSRLTVRRATVTGPGNKAPPLTASITTLLLLLLQLLLLLLLLLLRRLAPHSPTNARGWHRVRIQKLYHEHTTGHTGDRIKQHLGQGQGSGKARSCKQKDGPLPCPAAAMPHMPVSSKQCIAVSTSHTHLLG